MAIVPIAFRAETALELEDAFNAALLPLTANFIFGIEIDQIKPGVFSDKNLYGCFTSDASGAANLGTPFRCMSFSHATEASAIALSKVFIAANPGYFFSEIYVTYRPESPNPDQAVIVFLFYNTIGGGASVNWTMAVPASGAVGGDLSGSLPNPTVVGIQTVPVLAGPYAAGAALVYDSGLGKWVGYVLQVYTSLAAAAAAQANQVVGQNIIIFNTVPTPDDGTWQLTVKTASPADYTKVSDAVNVASEVALDVPIPPLTATNVQQALEQIVLPSNTGTAAGAATTVIGSVPLATVGRVDWYVLLQRGTDRYIETLHYTHNGAAPFGVSDEIAAVNFAFNATLAVAVVGANLELSVNNTGAAITYRVKAVTLPV